MILVLVEKLDCYNFEHVLNGRHFIGIKQRAIHCYYVPLYLAPLYHVPLYRV